MHTSKMHTSATRKAALRYLLFAKPGHFSSCSSSEKLCVRAYSLVSLSCSARQLMPQRLLCTL